MENQDMVPVIIAIPMTIITPPVATWRLRPHRRIDRIRRTRLPVKRADARNGTPSPSE